jgi:iron-sulfur cluster assembly accessory protein
MILVFHERALICHLNDTGRAMSIGADFFADSQTNIFNNKEAKASEAPAVSGPRMSENSHFPTCMGVLMLSSLLFLGIIFYAKRTNLGRCQSMTITDKAAEKARAILADEGKANWGIRIYVAGESCCGPSFGLNLQEVQMPEDEIVEKNGIKIFIDQETSKSLDGRELDFYTGEEGEGFIFTGGVSSCGTGGAGGSCGSGSSGCGPCGK